MRVAVTIEARMSATRLPGKVLFPLANQTVLSFLISRLKTLSCIDAIVVATTNNPVDLPIEMWARAMNVDVFRGSEVDVMGRVLGAARSVDADVIVELTGDNPLIDPRLIEIALARFKQGDVDYVSNVTERTFPLGMDTQVFSTATLEDAYSQTSDPLDREHVSLFIYRNPTRYRLASILSPPHQRRPELRVTLDTIEDYQLISRCAQACLNVGANFSLNDVIEFCDANPDLAKVNERVQHKWV